MFLKEIKIDEKIFEQEDEFPFNLSFLKYFKDDSLKINNSITFFIGENGSGKTTLIEAIAFIVIMVIN